MSDKYIRKTRLYLKSKLLNKEENIVGYDNERKQVLDLLRRTIEVGESNSALLIGPRGVGKTILVNDVLNELKQEITFDKSAILVRLHGLIHTDDRTALISATSQMNLDNAVDGKVFGSFAENLSFLLACLRTGKKETSKSVLFILEEFDLFCCHHNQTLLYNLFDISQSAQAPICILGITCRLDVIELLEKRVKSRFSHRQYFLFPGQNTVHHLNPRINRIENLLTIEKENAEDLSTEYIHTWNTKLKNIIKEKKFMRLMQRLLDIDLNENTLKNMLLLIISNLSASKPELTIEDFEEQLKCFEKDELVQLLQDLSILELCLLISMKHHVEIYDNQAMNFEMVFARYVKFASSASNIQSVQRPVVMKAFEHIENMELISIVSGTSGRLQKEYQMFKLLVAPIQLSEAIKKWQGLPTEVAQWAISSLI